MAAVTGQPLELVRPLMESLESTCCRATARGARGCTASGRGRFAARGGARARASGSARAAGGAVKVEREVDVAAPPERLYDVVMDPRRLDDWVTIHDHLVGNPPRRLEKGSQLTQCLKLAGRRFKVRWTVVENDPAGRSCGRARPRGLPRASGVRVRAGRRRNALLVPERVRPSGRPARAPRWRTVAGQPARSSTVR